MRRIMEAVTTRSPQSNGGSAPFVLRSDFPMRRFSLFSALGMGIHSVENERLFSFSRRAVQQVPLHLWACARDRVEFLDTSNHKRVQIRQNNCNTHTYFGAWSPVHARARRAGRVAR